LAQHYDPETVYRPGEEYPDPQYGCPILDKCFPFITQAMCEQNTSAHQECIGVWLNERMLVLIQRIAAMDFLSGPDAPWSRQSNGKIVPESIWEEFFDLVKKYLTERATYRCGEEISGEKSSGSGPVGPDSPRRGPSNCLLLGVEMYGRGPDGSAGGR
jgi:hypothetical protein